MGEYAAIGIWAGLGAVLAFVLALFHVRVPPRRAPPSEPAPSVDLMAALGRFQLQAALFVCFGFLAILLSAWAAGIGALGRSGLGVAALVSLPPLVGVAYLVRRGAVPNPADDDRPARPGGGAEHAPSPEDTA